MKHRRVIVSKHGGPDVLTVVEEPVPEPAPGEIRVKVLASGVSAYDLMFRRSGMLPGTPKVPFTLGEDVVGIVDKVGDDVRSFEIGQMVAGGTFSLGVGGGYAESLCMAAGEWVPVPAGVDPAEAVCLVVNYVTAHVMMHQAAKVKSGERILVQGAAGGVGTALLELGARMDLEMIGTASAHNHALVTKLGATPIDYRHENVRQRIRDLTGEGVDVVFDPVGGGRQLWNSYRTLRRGGRLVWFGVAAAKQRGLRVIPQSLLMRLFVSLLPDGRRAPLAPNVGPFVARVLAELLDRLADGELHPVIAARIPLIEAARAHELLESRQYAGKVVLVTDAYRQTQAVL
jgi:NADPH:quinone reductase-like Zn-dependent oxidoreductase